MKRRSFLGGLAALFGIGCEVRFESRQEIKRVPAPKPKEQPVASVMQWSPADMATFNVNPTYRLATDGDGTKVMAAWMNDEWVIVSRSDD